jgi:hypothetical protein
MVPAEDNELAALTDDTEAMLTGFLLFVRGLPLDPYELVGILANVPPPPPRPEHPPAEDGEEEIDEDEPLERDLFPHTVSHISIRTGVLTKSWSDSYSDSESEHSFLVRLSNDDRSTPRVLSSISFFATERVQHSLLKFAKRLRF